MRAPSTTVLQLLVLGMLVSIISTYSCSEPVVAAPGEKLARQYCVNCHQYPAPDLLPRQIWVTEILPDMGAFYGVYRGRPRSHYLNGADEAQYLESLYPKEATIDSMTWDSIVAFYIEQAPINLPPAPTAPVVYEMDDFTATFVSDTSSPLLPALTTTIDYSAEEALVYVGSLSGRGGTVRTFQLPQKTVVNRFNTTSPPVAFRPSEGTTLLMGSLVPSDQPLGSIEHPEAGSIVTGLTRPLDFDYCDLDLDGKRDNIVAEYGNMTGRLSYGHDGQVTILAETPGAIKLEIADMDQDGNDDLVVLFAQGNERIEAWLARPGAPERKLLYRFPPSYGSADLKVVDFDGDGDLDLIHACGDNYDYQPVTKAYHGLRLLRNNGSINFAEAWFYHLNGAYGVEVDDFDQDGDQDIAAIGYFVPKAERSTRSFVYLEQTGPLEFKSESFAKPDGQFYICITKGDVDQDGDQDLLLGNFANYLPDGMPNTRRVVPGAPTFVWLKNKLR